MKRIMVVDDSAFARKVISSVINKASDLEVVVTAASGEDALSRIPKVMPDVVTMDIEMPGMGGVNALQQIVEQYHIPVVVLSAVGFAGAEVSLKCLELGAVDVVLKPMSKGLPDLSDVSAQIVNAVRQAASISPERLQRLNIIAAQKKVPGQPKVNPQASSGAFPIVVIATSTGGPRALRYLLPRLNRSQDASYIVVQHLPVGFSEILARDLDQMCSLSVREARPKDVPQLREILVAPSGFHMVMSRTGHVELNEDPTVWGVRPSADVTMASVAARYPGRVIGVILTGMGRDGSEGASLIQQSGGLVLAEAESSCVIFGMPRAAIEKGAVNEIVDLEAMPEAIERTVNRMSNGDLHQ